MSTHGEAVEDIKKAKEALDHIIDEQVADITQHPDAKKHKYISFAKSGLRIVACVALAYYEVQTAAILFAVAELLGIAEEMV